MSLVLKLFSLLTDIGIPLVAEVGVCGQTAADDVVAVAGARGRLVTGAAAAVAQPSPRVHALCRHCHLGAINFMLERLHFITKSRKKNW